MENRKLGGHLGFLPIKRGFTPNLVENFFELKKDDITIQKMYRGPPLVALSNCRIINLAR